MRRTKLWPVWLVTLLLSACTAPSFNLLSRCPSLASAVSHETRSEENMSRDQYRHPLQTLQFFSVEPDMTVVEIWPGRGWYTEVLAPYLHRCGTLYAAGFDIHSTVSPAYRKTIQQTFLDKLAENPDVYSRVIHTKLEPPAHLTIAPPERADRVLTFRNVHNWVKDDTAADVFAAMYQALKPGGILGVVEHRAAPDTSIEDMKRSGYLTEALVKSLANDAGFEFDMSSEINANSKDTKNHPNGVWSLPPSLRGDDAKKAEYQSIGESDRMTLRFIKPKK